MRHTCTLTLLTRFNHRKYLLKNLIGIFILLCQTPSVFAQNDILDNAMRRLYSDTALNHGQVGICVMDAQTGQMLGNVNSFMSLIPASNMKLVTTAAGLKMLGNDYKYNTELQYEGTIQDSVLTGNIFIKGSGDPTLGSPLMDSVHRMQQVLDTFSLKIKQLGIKKINGKIIGDGTAFDKAMATPTWLWEDLGNYYGSGPSGLNFNENLYELNFIQNPNAGSQPIISGFTPFVPNFTMYNEVTSVQGGSDDAYIYAAPYATVGVARGAIPTGSSTFKISGSLPDPPYFAAWHLRRTLIEQGVDVADSATTQLWLQQKGISNSNRQTFYTWQSPDLATIAARTNLESVNLFCETILRTIAFKEKGEGSNDSGTALVKQFWKSKGIDTEGLFMQDGSGLSPRNGITPYQLANMLYVVSKDSTWFPAFYQSLPVSGLTGTMKGMFKSHPEAIGKIRAKSGTITRVRAYSGYATASSGRMIIFSVLLNNFTCSQRDIRKKLEDFMAELIRL